MICTNPSRNKKKNTINNHKKGHQQHENKGNLFRISNIAENVVAHVRINGQILKDVKSLRRVESDSSVLCFSVPQDYAWRAFSPSISSGAMKIQRIQI